MILHLSYLAVLAFIVVGTLWLEFALRTRVLRRPIRLVLSVLPVFALFVGWDLYAIAEGHWTFDVDRLSGVEFPGGLPIEEVLFFIVIPLAAILTFEAVRAVQGWPVGDEDDRAEQDESRP